jgi:hypothetical protein
LGHETTDISIRGVTYFLVALGVVLAVSGLGLWWFFDHMEAYARRSDQPASPVARHEEPPAPRLQVSAKADVQELRAAERQRLASYGWVDEKEGVAHIPIGEAMDRMAREGLPKWPAVQAQPPEGQQP